jgi:hypothetical protein
MMIQARSLRWVGFVACNRDHTKQNKDWSENLNEIYLSVCVCVCVWEREREWGTKIGLHEVDCILWCRREMYCMSILKYFYEHGDEVLNYIKVSKFLDWLTDYWRLKEDTVLHGINFTVALYPACTEVLNLCFSGMLCSFQW